MMNTLKRFWASCLDTHMKLALCKYAIIIIIIIVIIIVNIIIIISNSRYAFLCAIIQFWKKNQNYFNGEYISHKINKIFDFGL